jgi:hypothetical protein
VGADYLERAQAYQRAMASRQPLMMQIDSRLDLNAQTRAIGVTWMDQGEQASGPAYGFAGEVEAARRMRRAFLVEIGVLTDGEACNSEKAVKRKVARVNGYACSEEDDHLDLFVTIYRESDESIDVTREQADRAIQEAWRYFSGAYWGELTAGEAFTQGSLPLRRWMAAQIEHAGNRDTMLLFLERHPGGPRQAATYDDVPVEVLLPAFLVSELETAFTIGFRMLLPFLVLDILVATLVTATGLVMLPPSLVSLPLKLLVFVAADGWSLVVRSLLDSVRTLPS